MRGDAESRRATMTDVARAAGASLKTVSRYVNGEKNIDPTLAARIAEAIVALHFRRNLAAASIRPGQRSQLVGLIIEDVANPFYATLTRSIELALREQGLLLLAASSEEDPDQYCRLVEQLIERRVDGLIVVPPSDPGSRWPALAREVPALVMLDRLDPQIDADSIVADDEGGGRDACALLIESGCRTHRLHRRTTGATHHRRPVPRATWPPTKQPAYVPMMGWSSTVSAPPRRCALQSPRCCSPGAR